MPDAIDNKVDGFAFASKKELERAKKEKETIDKLKGKVDFTDIDKATEMYLKMVSKKYFVTAVGLSFLSELRNYLVENNPSAELPYIPVTSTSNSNKLVDKLEDERKSLKRDLKDKSEDYDKVAFANKRLIIAVVALFLCIIGMIVMVITSDNLGFVNAENKVLDKYAAWEEQLEQKEEELNQREDELNGITYENTTESDTQM